MKIVTIDVSSYPPQGMGALEYQAHPRIGEWVSVDIDSQKVYFEVIMVAHSSQGRGSDIFLKRLPEPDKAIRHLCEQA